MRTSRNVWGYYLMLTPPILLVLIYEIFPLFGLIIAFQDFVPGKGMFGSTFVGLDNFIYMFQLKESSQIFYNTIFIAVSKIVLNLIVPLIFALMLNEVLQNTLKRWIQTIVYLPHFMSWVILAGVLTNLLASDGIFNNIITALGFESIFFLGSNTWFPIVIIGSDVWKEFGFNAVIFLAALTAINPSLYEAAKIDGASKFHQLRYVTLPGIAPTIVLLACLGVGKIMNAGFEQIFNLYNPAVYASGDIIDTYVYRIGLTQHQYGLATAVGTLKSVVGFILVVLSWKLADKWANYRIF
ncbi:MAG: ABC transporter permease subunit [Candidatus Pristimantibacillus lignocellulolyticus]|uniref:ABC transporter permease subunit n=1 Tax=Candidatus Pristimantibacillus lignocellulolyticus TaxID=2994561 RepID=A0A9J6ZHT6_9BACL|nr:MAG: ABC transporter permease subunit [Candidatus Pristimantibacillus lignocellulolyticus]